MTENENVLALPSEERASAKINTSCYIVELVVVITLCVLGIIFGFFFSVYTFIVSIACLIACIYGMLVWNSETEVIINKTNQTLTLVVTKFCKCRGQTIKIINLNEIDKMYIFNSYDLGGQEQTAQKNSATKDAKYIVYYKNGLSEDLTSFFNGCPDESLIGCSILFKKYINILGEPLENNVVMPISTNNNGFQTIGNNPQVIYIQNEPGIRSVDNLTSNVNIYNKIDEIPENGKNYPAANGP